MRDAAYIRLLTPSSIRRVLKSTRTNSADEYIDIFSGHAWNWHEKCISRKKAYPATAGRQRSAPSMPGRKCIS
ncbi:hypothetical protein E4T56_gene3544 [Termitomyces sp. T112]|nr:hypothetical protein E4T56_gene3544 [Termitomyces sp. T112]